MPDKSDNWAGEYIRGSLYHKRRHRPSGSKIQLYQCSESMVNFYISYMTISSSQHSSVALKNKNKKQKKKAEIQTS